MDQQAPLYDRDFYEWTQREAAKLRAAHAARVNLDLDFENLAEEVESMGKSDLRAFENTLARVLEHLLKLEHSPALEPRPGWRSTVQVHRTAARRILDDSPSLRRRARVDLIVESAIGYLSESLNRHGEPVPELSVGDCRIGLDELLDPHWFPANRHGLTDR